MRSAKYSFVVSGPSEQELVFHSPAMLQHQTKRPSTSLTPADSRALLRKARQHIRLFSASWLFAFRSITTIIITESQPDRKTCKYNCPQDNTSWPHSLCLRPAKPDNMHVQIRHEHDLRPYREPSDHLPSSVELSWLIPHFAWENDIVTPENR